MFITQFKTNDNFFEKYAYRTQKEAEDHMMLFEDDDSGLYRNISVFDDQTNTITALMFFEDGKSRGVIKDGSLVRLRPEYASDAERHLIFMVRNINEVTERVQIGCLNGKTAIPATETVGLEMINVIITEDWMPKAK